jgi:hypothetical protein
MQSNQLKGFKPSMKNANKEAVKLPRGIRTKVRKNKG